MRNKLVLLTLVLGTSLWLGACNPTSTDNPNLQGAAVNSGDDGSDPGLATAVAPADPGKERPGAGSGAQPGAGSGAEVPPAEADKIMRDPKVAADVAGASEIICQLASTSPDGKTTLPDLVKTVQGWDDNGIIVKNGWLLSGTNWPTLLAVLGQYKDTNPSMKTYAQKLAGGQPVTWQEACQLHDFAAGETGRLAKGGDASGALGGANLSGIYAALSELGKPSTRVRLDYIEEACGKNDDCLAQLETFKASLEDACPQRAGCTDPVAIALLYGKEPSNPLKRQGICPVGDCARIADIVEKVEDLIGPADGSAGGDQGGGSAGGGAGAGGSAGGGTSPGGGAGGGSGAEKPGERTPTPEPVPGGREVPTAVPPVSP